MKKLILIAIVSIGLSSTVYADARSQKEQDYYTQVRKHATNLWEAIQFFSGEGQAEWNALDYGNTLDDGMNQHQGLTRTDLGGVVFDTTDAILVLFGQGHATNVAKLLLQRN